MTPECKPPAAALQCSFGCTLDADDPLRCTEPATHRSRRDKSSVWCAYHASCLGKSTLTPINRKRK